MLQVHVTVEQILAAHAQFGQLDRRMVKDAMGPNWPKEWDAFKPGPDTIFEAEKALVALPRSI